MRYGSLTVIALLLWGCTSPTVTPQSVAAEDTAIEDVEKDVHETPGDSQPAADTTGPANDLVVPWRDTGPPPSDTPPTPRDTAQAPADSTTSRQDTWAPDEDAGNPPEDTTVPQDTTGSNDTQSPLPDGAGDTALSPEDSSLPIDADNDTSTADTNPEPPAVPVECTEEWQSALYAQRIEPLVSGEKPSSCNQCHLSGMDLSMYAKGNPCQTMACMIEQGVVDLTAPEESEVLAQIAQADPQSALITKDIVEEEHSGFLEWIQYSALCHEHVCGEQLNACAAEAPPMVIPNDVPDPLGSCSEEALLDQFIEQVFVWRGRCHSCHDNCKPTYPAPCFLVDEFEDTEEGLKSAALITMYNLLGMDAIDPEVPFQSMMLLKPLSLPMGGVAHGGGTKFGDIADPALQDFQLWLESYSACYFGQELQTPIVTVTSPKDKKKYTEGAVIILKASVEDGQGSDFPPESVVWYSNQVSGVLATGLGPHTVVLGLGKHILTVAATDSDWNTGVRSIKIWVKAP